MKRFLIFLVLLSSLTIASTITWIFEREIMLDTCDYNTKTLDKTLWEIGLHRKNYPCYLEKYDYNLFKNETQMTPKLELNGNKCPYGNVSGLKEVILEYLCHNNKCNSWFGNQYIKQPSFAIYVLEEPGAYYSDENCNPILVEINYNGSFEFYTFSDIDNDNLVEINFIEHINQNIFKIVSYEDPIIEEKKESETSIIISWIYEVVNKIFLGR